MSPLPAEPRFAPKAQAGLPDNRLREPLSDALKASLARLDPGWAEPVRRWLHSPGGQSLIQAVEQRQAGGAVVYPAQVLRALELTPLDAVRVVILGQDPYHGPGQAQGLAFSVPPGMKLPPSLRNILQEIERDLGAVSAQARIGDLSGWAAQGVLLLNTSLTVEDGQAGAHARLGWHELTDVLMARVAARPVSTAFLLWGAHAQARQEWVPPGPERLVLSANHPSPLSARRGPQPFVGCGHFSQVQRFLQAQFPHEPPLVW